ncbi:hypothetical protein BDV28DRAFT_160069 [Aspergillus coremiiformis]|uniref:Uncharacterized protein n=1 Tax=Aspergillus coremiiformis TaxID=138285 RepID=A0A5N6YWU3_9EURO|nr:hypothetical protein BDV28DRAFT_160069 [Aspergillus coremiiformis]
MSLAMSLGATDRLRRSKSSRSIRKSHQTSASGESFDADLARQHATVAASLAMRRSTERSSTDSQRSYNRLGGPGNMAVPPRRHRPSGGTEDSDNVSTVTMPHSRLSMANDLENKNNEQLSPAALPPISEFGGLDGRNSSLPSSYRRLRKSRSMFTTGQRYSRISYGVPSRLYDSPRNVISQGKARSLSSSIKRGIKRVLGLSKSAAENNQAPVSPMDPKRCQNPATVFKEDGDCSTESDGNPVCIDRLADSHRPQTIPSTRSSESLATSRSRVTSWADSTVANTIVTRKAGEQGHLSIIDERGGSRLNLSLLTPSNSPRRECSSTAEPGLPERSIDSQRLYAALMRRIGQNCAQDPEEEIVLGQVREHRAIPTRASSLYPRSSRQTIRRVLSNDSITSPGSYATAPGGPVTPQKRPTMLGVPNTPEDDAQSIIATRSQSLDASDSPSIYSRTTSGNSPTIENRNAVLGSPEKDEPGVATIYESQRSAYSSPKRTTGSRDPEVQSRPSADWQQWMQSQMARIENFTPTGEHYREEAEIYGDAANVLRRFPSRNIQDDNGTLESQLDDPDHGYHFARRESTCKIGMGSNFSRPFGRSPSVRTMVTVCKEQTSGAAALSSIPISVSPNNSGQPFSVSRIRARGDQYATSPMHSRPINRHWMPETPTPKRDAREMSQRLTLSGKYGGSSAKWSPAQETRALPFRSVRHRDSTRPTNENLRADNRLCDSKEPYPLSQDTYVPISSKRMVEMFLNSRRRQMGTEMSDGSAPDGAFL